ncbi:hypothetical protein FACS1894106_1410 [Spirochaetia bacterium]|nr:hypothetical protein FACS1894106_1410 [Spirochaetia bacterium]
MEIKKDEKELLEDFRRLSPENRDSLLAIAHATRAAQENTKNSMNTALVPSEGKRSA